ncbi:PASTA domain-containing protein [Actinokineospora sp. HUAS TT18]|uniref:PASTA domain-containing protein n=1 Tax=Actinokineospora sp. HUAS TT18 TaxID=3447451 RepID=UPI003F51D862
MRLVWLAVAAALTACGPAAPAPSATQNPSSPAEGAWTMPDLVGAVLQDAQDKIQALTDKKLLFTDSHDATGQKREQVVDSNWKVCSQNVAPGTAITADTKIDFGAVKLTEQCP